MSYILNKNSDLKIRITIRIINNYHLDINMPENKLLYYIKTDSFMLTLLT